MDAAFFSCDKICSKSSASDADNGFVALSNHARTPTTPTHHTHLNTHFKKFITTHHEKRWRKPNRPIACMNWQPGTRHTQDGQKSRTSFLSWA